ncbi:hypothetical protein KUCAC02_036911, partial [Chaenocephalus aceratus]
LAFDSKTAEDTAHMSEQLWSESPASSRGANGMAAESRRDWSYCTLTFDLMPL